MKPFALAACLAVLIASAVLASRSSEAATSSIFPNTLSFRWFGNRRDFAAACVLAGAFSGEVFAKTPGQVTEWCGTAAQDIAMMSWLRRGQTNTGEENK